MKINIKNQLIQEGIVQHLKDNWGKYTVLGAGAGTVAAYNNGMIPTIKKTVVIQQPQVEQVEAPIELSPDAEQANGIINTFSESPSIAAKLGQIATDQGIYDDN